MPYYENPTYRGPLQRGCRRVRLVSAVRDFGKTVQGLDDFFQRAQDKYKWQK